MYVGKNYGFRADFTDVISFADFTTTSITNGTQDGGNFPGVAGLFPVSARLTQSGRFNQAIFSGGVFWDIGGRSTTDGYKAATGDRESMNDKWEFGINFGGTHGAPWGSDTASCAEAITGGCDFTSTSLTHRGGGPYPGHLVRGQIPETLVEGGLKPGDGWMTGFQIGYNWTQNWQIAFIYNILGTGTRFDNHAALENGIVAFFTGCDCNNDPTGRALLFDHRSDGRAQGIQHQFLVNLNRNFHVNSRIVPYVGAGLGGEIWAHNPEIGILVNTNGSSAPSSEQQLLLAKKYSSQTGFAVDLTGGVKFYVSRHWGFKAEAMNVTSFQEFGGRFASIDVNGFMGGTPGSLVGVSGSNKQSTRFNQTTGSGGLFWTF